MNGVLKILSIDIAIQPKFSNANNEIVEQFFKLTLKNLQTLLLRGPIHDGLPNQIVRKATENCKISCHSVCYFEISFFILSPFF